MVDGQGDGICGVENVLQDSVEGHFWVCCWYLAGGKVYVFLKSRVQTEVEVGGGDVTDSCVVVRDCPCDLTRAIELCCASMFGKDLDKFRSVR